MKERLIVWLVPRVVRLLILFFMYTTRWQIVGKPFSPADPQRYLLAFWHARMLMIPRICPLGTWFGYMLISSHRDGGFIADTMHLLGISTIRGSTTRGGARAMLQMVRAVRDENRHLGITPDGPKGPAQVVQRGTVQMALKAGIPVLPVCYATKRHWRVNSSWDRFYIPKPFSRGVMVMGEPVWLTAEEGVDESLRRVQQAMDEAQQRADSFFS
ncbi:DUF374 domain-containing protein [Mariprofundus erugo]|uniref:lysophospholipid acyltransferase family protein n=1 Tax=Mariprofundus erugo TaxID=2528639 RepID=UPI0010FE2384|nr:lysophospholipid acyltransferase family protein [Mariprofundus erugo]TLS75047.1 DUF374 domain-containing protein [Mariprofundus erugo]